MKRLAAAFTALSLCCLFPSGSAFAQNWTFAVSGDSRNCGDIVMPSIAEKVKSDHAAFYWHLGDYRASSDVDQDMLAAHKGKVSVSDYLSGEWPDFINQQLAPFGETPVYLAIGNHELIVKNRTDLLAQFADWYDAPAVRAQRLLDDPTDHALHTYYHWHEKNVDFITLDNASPEMFDAAQVKWLEALLKRDAADPAIRTIVLGMHEALPDSQSAGHSMNESPMEAQTGRKVYGDLLNFRNTTGKEVQVLASHSHFVMADPYNTACRKPEDVLSGWIVGTAGAVRYRLPMDHSRSKFAQTDVYGYLLATVTPEGHITFDFHPVEEKDVTAATEERFSKEAVHACFVDNHNSYTPDGPTCTTK
jgi:hypothetical protein